MTDRGTPAAHLNAVEEMKQHPDSNVTHKQAPRQVGLVTKIK